MKLALLGYSPESLPLIQGAYRLGHVFEVAYDATHEKEVLRAAAPGIRFRDDWESLLGQNEIEAVLVAGPWLVDAMPSDARERRDDQLRKLIQAGLPLLAIPPVCEGIVGFELEMIRRDVGSIVVPVMPLPLHAAWDDLADWLSHKASGPLGPVELVTLERFLPVRQRRDVLTWFVQDAEGLRRIAGPWRRLSASGGGRNGEAKPSLGSLAVHAEGETAFPVRWSVQPAGDFVGGKLTVLGASDRVVLTMPGAGWLGGNSSWHLEGPGFEQRYEPLDPVAAVYDELVAAIEKRSAPTVTWADASRAVEAMEAIDRSLARGRAIDLYNEEHSEESSFKGIMAASGCLLLLLTLGAFLLVAGFAALFPPAEGTGSTAWAALQICLIGVLSIFLLAQLLMFGLTAHRRRKQGGAR